MTDTEHDDLLTLKQIQKEYGRSYPFWWRRAGSVIPAKRYGAGWVIRRGDVEAFLATLAPSKP